MENTASPLICQSCGTPTVLPVVDPRRRSDEPVGYVHSVETCGTVDGPGLRYVLFLSGCPLRCVYCHNPDAQGKSRGPRTTVEEVMRDVLRYRNFIHDGGLTVSGGEPLLQAEFVAALFARAQQSGLHTALDTSGFRGDAAPEALLDHTDLVLLDIKSWDRATYKRVTGVAIDSTLAFARRLEQRGIPVWVRFVFVPGLTDDHANVEGLAEFVSTLTNVQRVQVLPFHKLAAHKYQQLGIQFRLEATPTPTPEQLARARATFLRHGIQTD